MSDRATTTASLTFESLYGTHHGWLKSWLTRKLQSAFDADDIAQDTFLRVMVSETLSTIRDPRSFLCTIAKRVMGMCNRVGYEPKIVMTVGVALNANMVDALAREMGYPIEVAPHCQAAGAIGAAVFAYEYFQKQ